jgi:hypothetical protein
MKTIADLKKRLKALPGIRGGRDKEAAYAEFLRKANDAKGKLQKVSPAIPLADSVLPAPGYQEAGKKLNQAARAAKTLAVKLKADHAAISGQDIDNAFTRLTENATDALNRCQTTWDGQIQGKADKWESLVNVLSNLDDDEAKAVKAQAIIIKSAIRSLREDWKGKLPEKKKDADAVESTLRTLDEAVAKLDLNTPFGKFLQATAAQDGAGLDLLQNEEVSKAVKKHKLQKVFRIRIS